MDCLAKELAPRSARSGRHASFWLLPAEPDDCEPFVLPREGVFLFRILRCKIGWISFVHKVEREVSSANLALSAGSGVSDSWPPGCQLAPSKQVTG